MRRALVAGLLAAVFLPAGLFGCGIPEQTEVHVDGRPEPAAEAGSLNGRAAHPPTRTATSDPDQFILNYLSAAAGEREQAYTRVKEFIAPESLNRLREKPQSSEVELTVVRLREKAKVTLNNAGTWQVTVPVQQVGVLRADGILGPPTAPDTEYKFQLREAGDGLAGLFITDLPNVLLLSDDALRSYYGAHTIYFWNTDQTRLVPDQRYLPSTVPAERRVTEVVKWLAGGPPDWLASGVTRLPEGTQPINNATGADGRWEVNLTMPKADDFRLARLATQLAWSLPDLNGELQLKIQNQNRHAIDLKQEQANNPLYSTFGAPERFCVYDGAIHSVSLAGESAGSVPVSDDVNKNVVSAALNRTDGEVLAALVVTRPDRRRRLVVGTAPAPVTLFNESKEWFGSVGRPVWLRKPDPERPAGLVVADGRLYRFDGMAVMTPVTLPVSGAVTAVAGSFDGHRIALIIKGELYVASVSFDGGVITVNQPRRLITRLTGLTAVDWYSENQLVFAGNEAGRPVIYQTTVDGGLETALKREVGAEVTQLAAYPGRAVGTLPSFSYMYEANKVAYRNNPVETIKPEQVQGVTPPTSGSKALNPTAPFFLY